MGKNMRLALALICMFSLILCSCSSSSDSSFGSMKAWTWISGSDTTNQKGIYGILGTPASSNVPGTRNGAVSWSDSNGILWLFGGQGNDSVNNFGDLDDLWKFDGKNWTWVSGYNLSNQNGIYNTPGQNVPGGRHHAVSWIDNSGNFWLFGGFGYDAVLNTEGHLNDLWKFDGATWTFVKGASSSDQYGFYTAPGTIDIHNVPGCRYRAVSWTDSSGNLWLFGGFGYDKKSVNTGVLNDLWRFDVSSSMWVWISGSDTQNQPGNYGTQGTYAAGNVPGAREFAVSWTDSSGNLWLFGGMGYDSNGTLGVLNDLWKFDVSSSAWTWVSGSHLIAQSGTYGTQGTSDAGNMPGARHGSVSWIDGKGNLWLFGGYGYDSNGIYDLLNDLWKFDVSSSTWTWVSGSHSVDQYGSYAKNAMPGARYGSVSWIDGRGNLRLFGGHGYALAGAAGELNDFWRYHP